MSVLGEIEPCRRISLKIEDYMGTEIDEVGFIDISDADQGYRDDYDKFQQLYEMASRSVRNIDAVIYDIINELS